MIFDNDPMVNQYISLPREMRGFNAAAYVAGIIEGFCDGAGFATEGVSAHNVGEQEAAAAEEAKAKGGEGTGKSPAQMWPNKTVFLIQFKQEVLEREEILNRGGG
jgi:hypothetical protein